MRTRQSIPTSPALVAMLALLVAAPAQPQDPPKVPANQLVRDSVSREVKQKTAHQERFRYKIRTVKPERTETKVYVETTMGTVARLVARGDQPLNSLAQANENARLQGLLDHPDQQREKQRRQQQDEERVKRMVAALPDAFNFEYDGTDTGTNGEEIRLRFTPNPQYDPPTRELRVYQGMQGKLWLDAGTHHIARLQAELFRDVDFGWGILGRLYKGGHFDIEQSRLGDGRWETTHMNLDFNGRIMMLKSLRIQETQDLSDVHPIDANLSLAQGIDLLRKYDPEKNVVAGENSTANGHGQKR